MEDHASRKAKGSLEAVKEYEYTLPDRRQSKAEQELRNLKAPMDSYYCPCLPATTMEESPVVIRRKGSAMVGHGNDP